MSFKAATNRASTSSAEGARNQGSIDAFHNVDAVETGSRWRNFEYPELKENINIIFHDAFK